MNENEYTVVASGKVHGFTRSEFASLAAAQAIGDGAVGVYVDVRRGDGRRRRGHAVATVDLVEQARELRRAARRFWRSLRLASLPAASLE